MADFGGVNALRNAAFRKSFRELRTGLRPGHLIDVAGFTGLVNNTTAPGILTGLSASLMGLPAASPPSLYTVACGRGDSPAVQEYISIALRPPWVPCSVGRILLEVRGRRVTFHHDVSPAMKPEPGWAHGLPTGGASPGQPGLVYVVISQGLLKVAVGFLHNRSGYSALRERVRLRIPLMLRMVEQHPLAPAICYIGGGFNVPPDTVGLASTGEAFAYALGPTTMQGHTSDYWYCRVNPFLPAGLPPGFIVPVPSLGAATLGLTRSPHAACLLRVS